MKVPSFAKLFDHSILRPDATHEEVRQFAETAVQLGTATLTVQPHYIRFAAEMLKNSDVLLGTVVGFPHGNETPSMKEYQAKRVLDLGAQEIDMVMNIPALKNREENIFIRDIEGVVRATHGAIVKVITENSLLSDDEKRRACQWIVKAGAHFVKTSTAYTGGGATLEDVQLMVEAVKGKCLVKAAGGLTKIEQILEYLKAGARRFGSSRTEQFISAFHALPQEMKAQFSKFASYPC
ncbi:deoxyribose-phosphate aldolase [Acidobacteria bacterium AH-259-L09]|nr:deoxyribose-phosphate aldolase [Acidobacteria bacterium AH-259-L09]